MVKLFGFTQISATNMKALSDKQPTSFLGIPLDTFQRALAPQPASDALQENLAQIAAAMMIKGGKLDAIDPALLRELGSILLAVANGKPANRLFRQNERTKQRRTNEFEIAFVYHYMRACSEDLTDDSPALAQLRAAQQLKAPKSPETIRKIAQKHRDRVLEKFEQTSHAELGEMMIRLTANAKQVEDLLCTISGAGSEQQQLDGQKLIDHWTRRELTPQKKKAWRRYLLRKSPHMRD